MSEHTSHSTRQPARSDAAEVLVSGTRTAGLLSGLALHEAGYDVTVARAPDEREAGRVSSVPVGPDIQDALTRYADADVDRLMTTASEYRYLAPDGTLESSFGTDHRVTASDTLESVLRDALPDACFARDLTVDPGCAPLETDPHPTTVETDSDEYHDPEPDLFVGADGWLSPTRRRVLPEVTPQYAGYVAWHGQIPESMVPSNLMERFVDAVTISRGSRDLLVVSVLPGSEGGSEPGGRRLHWTWYTAVPARDLGAVLTDQTGTNHDKAVPPGDLQHEYVDGLRERATDHAPAITRLVRATPDPGVEPVVDISVPRAVVGRTVLVGDAAFTSRDHTGTATWKAAEDATTLADALDRYASIDAALADWAATQELRGRQLVEQGRHTDLGGLAERV